MKAGLFSLALLLCGLAWGVQGLYDKTDDVIELTKANFVPKVLASDQLWIVEFYAPWCGHCKALAPEYKKVAKALKGIVKVGAIDMEAHQAFADDYPHIKGFPTIHIFGENKRAPAVNYLGDRTADAIISEALNQIRKMADDRLGTKTSSGSSGKSGKSSGGSDKSSSSGGGDGGGSVITLTDKNFEELVLQSEDMWLVEFFAPWCGHCKNLAPHWAAAAKQLGGKVKLGAVDATAETVLASRYQIQGYPTIKFFEAGKKNWDSAKPYDGGRTTSDIVQWALDRYTVHLPPPEIYQLTSDEVLQECTKKQLCMVAFLPHILDSGAAGRNGYIKTLKELGEKYKQRSFGWIWAEGGANLELEQSLDIGGFGYPALSAVNSRKKVFSILRGAFSDGGITDFVRELVGQKGVIIPLKQESLPTIATIEPWDGQDGQLPEEDDWDLSDFDMDEDTEQAKDEL